ncbi:MAG: sirohydrochlorin cobaltochelatase [Deltaproteobacteria bacterium]|nr:sirohydrochlorin cobaltochelatase [Deltaproteobacteria bacterium]
MERGREMKLNKHMLSLLVMIALLCCSLNGFAAHGEKKSEKKAILLVAFGTSVPEARKVFDRIDEQTRKAFSDVEIRWAFTSKIIRAKLAKEGKMMDSPEMALSRLMNDGYTHVAVLSLQTIPGEEFHELYQNAQLFGQMAGGFEKILVARPLLSSAKDMEIVAGTLMKNIPGRKPEDAVIFMGHGTGHHPADAIYLAMNQVFQEIDPRAFVRTVEGNLTIETLLSKLKQLKIKKVYLVPMMSVAGDHAKNDMAGDEPDSWKSILTRNGYQCESILKGTADYPEIVEVWLDHLRTVLTHF